MPSFTFNPSTPMSDQDIGISYSTDKESLYDNQVLLKLVIISFILMTLTFDSRGIL